MPPRITAAVCWTASKTLAQKIGVSMPELDVIGGCGSGLKPDCLADHEGHGFGLGLADLLGGQGAAVAPVQHLVGDLVRERGKLLGGLHPGKQRDLPAMRETLWREQFSRRN